MDRQQKTDGSRTVRVLLVACTVSAGLLLSSLLRAFGASGSTPVFLSVVAVCALRWSIAEGLLAVALSAIAIALELTPQYRLHLAQGPILINLALFLPLSALLLWLIRKSASAADEVRATEQRFRVALLKSGGRVPSGQRSPVRLGLPSVSRTRRLFSCGKTRQRSFSAR